MQWFPSPPTDSLYKFAAILGAWSLAFILAGFFAVEYANFRLEEHMKQIPQAGYSAQISHDIKKRLLAISEGRQSDDYLPGIALDSPLNQNVELLRDSLERHQKSIAALEESSRDPIFRWIDIARFTGAAYIYLIICSLGASVGVWGFVCWYQRIQVPSDVALLKQALEIAPDDTRLLKQIKRRTGKSANSPKKGL